MEVICPNCEDGGKDLNLVHRHAVMIEKHEWESNVKDGELYMVSKIIYKENTAMIFNELSYNKKDKNKTRF